MTNTVSYLAFLSATNASAESNEGITNAAWSQPRTLPGSLLRTMFSLPASGRNRSGMDSQVFRPMMQTLHFDGSLVSEVSCLKYAISPGSFQGSAPSARGKTVQAEP